MIIRMCGGAEMLHRVGFVHRDIVQQHHGECLRLSGSRRDFGAAEQWGQIRAVAAMVFHRGRRPSRSRYGAHPSDAGRWALGATLWTLMGRPPFEPDGDNTARAVEGNVGPCLAYRSAGVPDAVTYRASSDESGS